MNRSPFDYEKAVNDWIETSPESQNLDETKDSESTVSKYEILIKRRVI